MDSDQQLQREAEQRWGDTSAWAESQRRARGRTTAQWAAIRAEMDDIERRMADLCRGGHPPASDAAVLLAEEHRAHLERWFYDCPPAQHRALGRLYVDDARFTAHHDQRAEGLAGWVRDAIEANAHRLEARG